MTPWMRNFLRENGEYMRRSAIMKYLVSRRFNPGGWCARYDRKQALRTCAEIREAMK